MYDNIFDDFNTIKDHCERNGNIAFEESAVFELLENLCPQHGSIKAIQIIMEMLDVQRIRDSKDTEAAKDVTIVELSNSDKSNDSIIEVAVPKKVHTVIDLTDNSVECDKAIVIVKPDLDDFDFHDNDSVVSDDGNNGLSDCDLLRHSDEDLTNFNAQSLNNESSLLDYLALLEQPSNLNQYDGNLSNNNTAEVPEILEENNNDPNNNLGDQFENDLHAQGAVNYEDNPLPSILHFEGSNSNEIAWNDIVDPMPSCSKDTEAGLNDKVVEKNVDQINDKPQSPIPGCSKEFDFDHAESMDIVDESIQNDALCIQEIMSWAEFETIYSILRKYKDLPNRKQLTLDDLITYQDQKEAKRVKRKSEKDTCSLLKKHRKLGCNDDMEIALAGIAGSTAYSTFENIIFNESSNDTKSLKASDCDESSSHSKEETLTEQPKSETESIESLAADEKKINVVDHHLFNISSNSTHTHNLNTNDKLPSSLSTPAHQLVTSCQNASGKNDVFTKIQSNAEIITNPLNEKVPSIDSVIKKNLGYVPEILVKNDNGEERIDIMKDFANRILQNEQRRNEQTFTLKSEKNEVLKPAKLIFQRKGPHEFVIKPSAPIVKPATFNYKAENSTSTLDMKVRPEKSDTLHSKRNGAFFNLNQQNTKLPDIALPRYIITKKKDNIAQNVHSPVLGASSKTAGNKSAHKSDHPLLIRETTAPRPIVKPTVLFNGFKQETVIKPESVHKYTDNPFHLKLNQLHKLKFPKPTATITSSTEVVSVNSADPHQPSTSGTHNFPAIRKEVPDRAVYNKLRSIFPEVKKSYVKQICISPPNIDKSNDKEQVLNTLIDHLLSEGSKHLRPYQEVFEHQIATSLTVDEKYENLLGIFPDADPTYLREFVEKDPSEQDFEQFVQQKLESRDYPTKEQYMARIKITQQIKQYTTDFNVESFLELFPDPFKYFEDNTRQCTYQPIAMEFLKSVFNKNKVNTITKMYSTNGYNLGLTARQLTAMGPDMKSKRCNFEMPTENIPLLQEMAFVKNKKNIENHLNMLKVKEEQLFNQLKEQNLLLTCQCCFNDECMPTKSSECNKGHVFCYECIIRGTESTLADGEAQVRCFTECDGEFPLATLQKVLPPTKFSALLQKRQAAEVIAAGVDGLISCPFCHFASIPPPEDKVFKCLNPECMKETCRLCKELNHVPLKCDEVIKSDKARRLIEEKMTQALIRTCYQCKKQFYKEDGCNKMKCSCGALMCYLCDKPIKGYDHFNAQGGANTNLCPLWSDDRFLNAKAVIKVAEEVKRTLLKDNPNLKIDTEGLLPKLPPKTKGPHDDIPNANQLPEHVRRLAGAAP